MHNSTFTVIAGAVINAGQYVVVDRYTRCVVPTDDIEKAVGRAVTSTSLGGWVEVSPLLSPRVTGRLIDCNALSIRIYRLRDLELEHARWAK